MLAQSENRAEPAVFHRYHPYLLKIIKHLSNFKSRQYFSLDEKECVKMHLSPNNPDNESIVIALPWDSEKDPRRFNYLGRDSREQILKEVKSDFYLEMRSFIKILISMNYQRKIALLKFCEIYDINEDDLKLGSIYRQSSRMLRVHRKKNLRNIKIL